MKKSYDYIREELKSRRETNRSQKKEYGGEYHYIANCEFLYFGTQVLIEEIPEMEYHTLDFNHRLGWEYS
jgi:hypothetical protein